MIFNPHSPTALIKLLNYPTPMPLKATTMHLTPIIATKIILGTTWRSRLRNKHIPRSWDFPTAPKSFKLHPQPISGGRNRIGNKSNKIQKFSWISLMCLMMPRMILIKEKTPTAMTIKTKAKRLTIMNRTAIKSTSTGIFKWNRKSLILSKLWWVLKEEWTRLRIMMRCSWGKTVSG